MSPVMFNIGVFLVGINLVTAILVITTKPFYATWLNYVVTIVCSFSMLSVAWSMLRF